MASFDTTEIAAYHHGNPIPDRGTMPQTYFGFTARLAAMLSRLTTSERIAGGGAIVGVIASFLTWYGYTDASSQITVNGFRASVLGIVFFGACVVTLMLVAARARLLTLGHIDIRLWAWTGIAAAVTAVGQLLLTVFGGRSVHAGLWLAAATAMALLWSVQRREGERTAPFDQRY